MPSTIVLDNKRRATFGSQFEPGDSFLREVNGDTVIFRKLKPVELPLARAKKVGGKWMAGGPRPSRQAILEAIKRDRESR
jgi:hypothetical protein